jgi:hypothetical protein
MLNMSDYFVVPFTYEDVQENRDVDFNVLIELALIGTEQKLRKDPSLECHAISVDVRFYRRSISSPTASEYDQYSEVIFMNEGGMRIVQDHKMTANVLKVIAAEDLPKGLAIQWQKMYLPLSISGAMSR